MIHQRVHPGLNEDNCYGCKIAGVGFGAVPGGTRPAGKAKAIILEKTKGMDEYVKRRKAGERPDGLSMAKIRESDKRIDAFQKMEPTLREDNPKYVVDDFARRVANG